MRVFFTLQQRNKLSLTAMPDILSCAHAGEVGSPPSSAAPGAKDRETVQAEATAAAALAMNQVGIMSSGAAHDCCVSRLTEAMAQATTWPACRATRRLL